MKSFGAVLLTLVALVLAVVALREAGRARQARSEFATAAQERDALRARLDALEKKQTALQTENDDLRSRNAEVANAPAPPPPVMKPFTAALSRGRLPGPMEAFDSPEIRQLMAIEQKGRLDARYAALFKQLHLSPEKLDRFKQLLIDRQNAPMDVMAAAGKPDAFGPETGANIPGLIQQETQEVDVSIHRLLGDTAYDEFQDFNRTQSERSVVDQLASRLSYSDVPLTGEQAEALVNLLSAERATQTATAKPTEFGSLQYAVASPAGGDVVFSTFGRGSTTSITDNSIASAQTVLSDAQMNALRALQAEQLAQQKMGQLMQQSFPLPPPGAQAGTFIAVPANESTPHP
jgi:hypothetical protein